MIKAAKPIMKKKLRKRGNFLARLLTSTPSPELAEIYVREEIVKKMQDRRIKMLDGDTMFEKMDPDCDKKASGLLGWFWGNTTETDEKKPKEDETQPRKLLKRIGGGAKKSAQTKLGKGILVAVASALLGVALLPL